MDAYAFECYALSTFVDIFAFECYALSTFVDTSAFECYALSTFMGACAFERYVLSTFVDACAFERYVLSTFVDTCAFECYVLSTLVDTCGGLLWFVHFSGHRSFHLDNRKMIVCRYQKYRYGRLGGFYDKVSALSGIKKGNLFLTRNGFPLKCSRFIRRLSAAYRASLALPAQPRTSVSLCLTICLMFARASPRY